MDVESKERTESGKKHAANQARWKLFGNVVMAMKRFQAALNPTYSYGKRPASPTHLPTQPGRQVSQRTHTLSGRTTSGERTLSGRPGDAGIGKQHGHKGNILFKPLPPLPSEETTVA